MKAFYRPVCFSNLCDARCLYVGFSFLHIASLPASLFAFLLVYSMSRSYSPTFLSSFEGLKPLLIASFSRENLLEAPPVEAPSGFKNHKLSGRASLALENDNDMVSKSIQDQSKGSAKTLLQIIGFETGWMLLLYHKVELQYATRFLYQTKTIHIVWQSWQPGQNHFWAACYLLYKSKG